MNGFGIYFFVGYGRKTWLSVNIRKRLNSLLNVIEAL